MTFHGIFPPVPTPFDHDDAVDGRALRSNIEQWMRTGLSGIVALGSNGEAPFLDEEEADCVVAAAREATPRDRVLIVGTGRESTRATIAASRRAAGLGADAVLVRTPSFFKSRMTTEVLVSHYQAVADACPAPVLLYNFTAVTGVDLPVQAVSQLAEHPNIVGMKESNSDVGKIATLAHALPGTFSIVAGSLPILYPSLCVGAVGGILAAACVMPDLCVRLLALVDAGRHEEALALQRRITPLASLVTGTYGVPGLKAALNLVGMVGGRPRPPLAPFPEAAIEDLRRELSIVLAGEHL